MRHYYLTEPASAKFIVPVRRTKTHHHKYVHVTQYIVHYSNVISQSTVLLRSLVGACVCRRGLRLVKQTRRPAGLYL